jgi:hypothetical protein
MAMIFSVALSLSGVVEVHETPITALHELILGLESSPTGSFKGPLDHSYDSESFIITVNICTSKCMTNLMTDFIESPRKIIVKIKGVAGDSLASFVGTVK